MLPLALRLVFLRNCLGLATLFIKGLADRESVQSPPRLPFLFTANHEESKEFTADSIVRRDETVAQELATKIKQSVGEDLI